MPFQAKEPDFLGDAGIRLEHLMVYAAESKALATLELLVHMDDEHLMNEYLCIPVRFDPRLVRNLDLKSLPKNWRATPLSYSTQNMGDAWW